MIKKLLPVILLLVGTGAGIGAGIATTPAPEEGDGMKGGGHEAESHHEEADESPSEFIKLDEQFVVPVIKADKVVSMIVLALSLETDPGMMDAVFVKKPKLRDLFLRVLFDHSNMGGFRGAFTRSDNMELLRTALREVAQKEMGTEIRDVLITDIGRQDY